MFSGKCLKIARLNIYHSQRNDKLDPSKAFPPNQCWNFHDVLELCLNSNIDESEILVDNYIFCVWNLGCGLFIYLFIYSLFGRIDKVIQKLAQAKMATQHHTINQTIKSISQETPKFG